MPGVRWTGYASEGRALAVRGPEAEPLQWYRLSDNAWYKNSVGSRRK
jgi:hypothetical protein